MNSKVITHPTEKGNIYLVMIINSSYELSPGMIKESIDYNSNLNSRRCLDNVGKLYLIFCFFKFLRIHKVFSNRHVIFKPHVNNEADRKIAKYLPR